MHMHRSQTIAPAGKDIEYRITAHQPMKQEGSEMVPAGDPYPVVELFRRDGFAELIFLARFKMVEFVELSREVVKVGKVLVPPKDDADETSVSD